MGSNSDVSDECRVRVTFKPKGVKPVRTTNFREVVFLVEGDIPDQSELFERAYTEAIDQDVISQHSIWDHWEPYRHDCID